MSPLLTIFAIGCLFGSATGLVMFFRLQNKETKIVCLQVTISNFVVLIYLAFSGYQLMLTGTGLLTVTIIAILLAIPMLAPIVNLASNEWLGGFIFFVDMLIMLVVAGIALFEAWKVSHTMGTILMNWA